MIHKERGKAAKKDRGYLRDYPYKNEYTYLGITIDRNLTLNSHLQKIKDKIKKGSNLLYLTNKKGLDEWRRTYL